MKFNFKSYKTLKTKHSIQKNNLLFFFNSTNRTSNHWVLIEQSFKNMNFNYYKIFNKITYKIFNNSIFKNFKSTINGITFLVKPVKISDNISKKILFKNFDNLLFNILVIKLNNKFYQNKQLKNLNYLKYNKGAKLLLFKFLTTNNKLFLEKSK